MTRRESIQAAISAWCGMALGLVADRAIAAEPVPLQGSQFPLQGWKVAETHISEPLFENGVEYRNVTLRFVREA